MAKRKPKLWLARDKCYDDDYHITVGTKAQQKLLTTGGWCWTGGVDVCVDEFEKVFVIRLKPGEGPVEVEVTIRRAKPKRKSK